MIWLFACVLSADETGGSDSAAAEVGAPECDPITLSLNQDIRQDELPTNGPLDHAEPGVALGDLDGDGDLDALVAYAGGAFGLRNSGGTLTVDPSITIDGGTGPLSISVALADLDDDGDLDAFLGEWPGGDLLLENDGSARFTSRRIGEVVDQVTPWTGAFGDADGDGDLDLLVATRVPDIEPALVLSGEQFGTANYLYLNEGSFVFRRDDTRIPAEGNDGLTFHAAWIDAEGDGDLDIYDANDWGYYIQPNRLLRNDGSGFFSEDESCGCDVAMYAMGAAVGDANADGLPDLYITDIESPNLLASFDGASFYDATVASGAEIPPGETNFTSWGTSFGDFNLDGCMDLVAAFGRLGDNGDEFLGTMAGLSGADQEPENQSNVMLQSNCDGGFTRVEGTDFDEYLDRDRSIVVGDIDGDGRPDLVSAGRQFVRVWTIGGGCDGAAIQLDGPSSNAAGIGAKVSMVTDDRSTVQWMLPSTTHSQSALELYFGLGTQSGGEVTVEWADGSRSSVDVATGSRVVVSP